MVVNTDQLVPMTEANQNFAKVVRMVDFVEYEIIAVAMQMPFRMRLWKYFWHQAHELHR